MAEAKIFLQNPSEQELALYIPILFTD